MLKNMWIIGFDLIVWYDIKLCDIYIYIYIIVYSQLS